MATRQAPRGAGPRFVYKPRGNEAAINRMQQYNSGNRDGYLEGNIETFTPAEGDNWVRLMPPTWENAQHWAFDLYIHYDVGPDRASYLCIEKMYDLMDISGYPIAAEFLTDGVAICAMCEELRRAQRAGETEYGRALDANLRLAAWMINRNDEKAGPKMWMYPTTNDKEILAQATNRRTGEVLAIDDPENGFDLDFHRKGKAMNTKYSGFKLNHQPSPVDEKAVAFVVENPIPKLLKFYHYDHIMEVFAGPAAAAPKSASRTARDEPESDKDADAQIPHDPPPEKPAPAARRTPLVTPKAADKPAETAAPTPVANNRRRAQQKPASLAPDFAAMDTNGHCDWADANNVIIPDEVSDDDLPAFLTEEWKKLNP